MHTHNMNSETLFYLAHNIINTLEEILPKSLSLAHFTICENISSELFISVSHIRNVFKLATNMSIIKYITRRKYTILLLRMSEEGFKNLTIHKQYYGIKEFKRKCLHEFPNLNNNYTPEHMQPPINKTLLRDLLNTQIEKKGNEYLMKSLYKDIIKGRTPYEIKENCENIVIKNSDGMIVDLEKTYFVFEDKVFKITANLNIPQIQAEEPFLSMLFGQPIYPSYVVPTDANFILHMLYEFFTDNSIITNGFSLIVEWGHKNGWGSSNLISSMSFENDVLTDVKFTHNPFLLFDDQKILLDLSFFARNCFNNLHLYE